MTAGAACRRSRAIRLPYIVALVSLAAVGLAVAAGPDSKAAQAGTAADDAGAPASAKPAANPSGPGVIAPPDITFVEEPEESTASQGGANPFGSVAGVVRQEAVPGYIELSTGLKIPGKIYTTRAKRLKIYNLAREMYEYVPVPALKQIETTVEWEREDKEWRFKEAGNPEKIYSGRTYPVRKTAYTLTLRNDHRITGHILGQPLYVEHGGKAERFILHDRDKGDIGATLDSLIYIKSVAFGPEAYNEAVEELKAKAEAAAKKGAAEPRKSPAKK